MTSPVRAGWGLVAAAAAAWTALTLGLDGVLPMWVEGMPAYIDQVLGVLRRACTPPPHTLDVAGRPLPLGVDAYQGPLMVWLDVPFARAWLGGLTDDPAAYRAKGPLLLALAALLAYPLLLRVAPPGRAALGAVLLLTLPVANVVALGDLQFHVPLLCALAAIAWPLVRYAEARRPAWLVVAAFAAGASLLTRAEVLVWTAATLTVWLAFVRRDLARAAWQALSPGRLAAVLAAFALGAAPTIAMNLLAPTQGLGAFLATGGATSLDPGRLAGWGVLRLVQFGKFVLGNSFGLYAVRPDHLAFIVLGGAAIAFALVAALRERRWPLALVALAVVLPLSVLANRGPRDIHLLPLVLPVVALATALAARVPARLGAALLVAGIAANIVQGATILERWAALRALGADTVATAGCPACLVAALDAHPGARVVHTNLGTYAEVLWTTRAHACGVDIHQGIDFREAVLHALEAPGTKVYVAYPPLREAHLVRTGRGYKRTAALLDVLREAGMAAAPVPVRDAGGQELYRLYVVRGQAPARFEAQGGGFNAPQAGRVTGWVVGHGFRPGDVVRLNGRALPTTVGSAALLTFAVEEAEAPPGSPLAFVVERGGLRSGTFALARP